MRGLFTGIVVIIAAGLLVTAIGALLSKEHVAKRDARLNAPPDAVWKLITDVEAFPEWRRGVSRVERVADADGRAAWAEHTSSGRITLAIHRAEPPRLLVVGIADPDLPFGGTWTYELQPDGRGTRLTIVEHGEVYNPIFRFMARFVFGHEATLAEYMDSLQKKAALAESNDGV